MPKTLNTMGHFMVVCLSTKKSPSGVLKPGLSEQDWPSIHDWLSVPARNCRVVNSLRFSSSILIYAVAETEARLI